MGPSSMISSPMGQGNPATSSAAPGSDMAGPSAMAGSDPSAVAGANSQPNQGEAMKQLMEVMRGMEMQLQGLTQQFPQASSEITQAIQALRGVSRAVIANPNIGMGGQGQEPSAPV